MQKQIEELKRKAEQGSEQLQGEVQELVLENLLHSKFPDDLIEPVPKGEHGGDVLRKVVNQLGQQCGTIIWESKRTKAWSDTWLPKLREDQRAATNASDGLYDDIGLFILVIVKGSAGRWATERDALNSFILSIAWRSTEP